MASLSAAAAVCLMCAAAPNAPASLARWHAIIADASARFGLPEDWIAHVMEAESAGRTMRNGKPVRSVAGAMGLMQLMPGTFANMRRQFHLGSNPYDPRTNIMAGTAYLRVLYNRFGYPALFAAYHAGPGRFEALLWHGRPLQEVTMAYVRRVMAGRFAAPRAVIAAQNDGIATPQAACASPLFFVLKSPQMNLPPTIAQNANILFRPLSSPIP